MMRQLLSVDESGAVLVLGRERENAAREIAVDYGAWAREYGEGTLTLLLCRSGDALPYPVELTEREGHIAVWRVSDTDTAKPGYGRCEAQFYSGDARVKSAVWRVYVTAALPDAAEPPEPYETVLERIGALAAQTVSAAAQTAEDARTAAAAAESAGADARRAAGSAGAALTAPYIANGTWWVYDAQQEAFVDSRQPAQGAAPQRGTDYWTAADKQEIVGSVLAALPDADGEVY